MSVFLKNLRWVLNLTGVAASVVALFCVCKIAGQSMRSDRLVQTPESGKVSAANLADEVDPRPRLAPSAPTVADTEATLLAQMPIPVALVASATEAGEESAAPSRESQMVEQVKAVSALAGIGPDLATSLAQGYLAKAGYTEIEVGPEQTWVRGGMADTQLRISWEDLTPTGGSLAERHNAAIAYEGVALHGHREHPCTSLTVRQIKAILNGEFTQWETVGSKGGKINLYLCKQDVDKIESVISRSLRIKPTSWKRRIKQTASTFEQYQELVASDPQALGLANVTFSDTANKILSLKADPKALPIMPSRLSFASGAYSLSQPVSLIIAKSDEDPALHQGLMAFARSAAGQNIVRDLGYRGYDSDGFDVDQRSHDLHMQYLLSNESVPEDYRKLVATADRLDSPRNLYFRQGKMLLTEESSEYLDDVAAALKRDGGTARALLIGFTDHVGTAEENVVFSQQRAHYVRKRLIERGIKFSQSKGAGFGEEMPLGDNETEEGRALNRRVEVWMIRQ